MYTVKQLSDLAEVSVRTLHYYDEIGLLNPPQVGGNGYRYYDDAALLRLQQILFYREIGLELKQIKDILDSPDFDLVIALESHREALKEKMHRLQNLISTVDETIGHLTGEVNMSNKKKLFQAFSDEQQKQYEREARLQYGPENVNESVRRWNNYSNVQKEIIMDEGNEIYTDLVALLEEDAPTESAEVQAVMARWHQHLRYFYEPTLEILNGLGLMYNSHPDFIANFKKIHPDLPEYLSASVAQYVDDLEYAEIERMLAEDEERAARE
ncbi:MAG: MerR family transcriptional regulator [Anaerolineae bacterium]|nr:MerR family transcriptional regulator [Anaerolineae bacterium]